MSLKVQSGTKIARTEIGENLSAAESAKNKKNEQMVAKTAEPWQETLREPEVSLTELETGVDGLNAALKFINRGLRFIVHEGSNRVMVKVVDLATQEVIKEIPPQKFLDTVARIRDMIGLLLDQWA